MATTGTKEKEIEGKKINKKKKVQKK